MPENARWWFATAVVLGVTFALLLHWATHTGAPTCVRVVIGSTTQDVCEVSGD